MIKLAVCDDESIQREKIVHMIEKALNLKNIEFKIYEFKNGEELLLLDRDIDIYFLDIRMNKLTGIETAKKIRLKNNLATIIFITALKDYVFDAFDVQAFHYILKPVNQEKLNQILYSALHKLEKKDKFIIAKTISESTKIFIKDIIYIESQLRKVKVHTTYSIIEYYYKLSDIEQQLSACNFFRCHKSYLVNLNYVRSFDTTFISLKNSEKIYISKNKFAEFSKAFMYYLKDEE